MVIESGKHIREMYTSLNPTFIDSKTGVCRGIPIFLIVAPKHRLLVLELLRLKRYLYIAWACFRRDLEACSKFCPCIDQDMLTSKIGGPRGQGVKSAVA